MMVNVDKQALLTYREQLVCIDPTVPSGKEYLQTVYESVANVKTCGAIYQ